MHRRPVRLALILAGLLATGALGYRVFSDEQSLTAGREAAAALDRSAEQALVAMSDLKAALHAYVAPGQVSADWTKRSSESLDLVRQRLSALESPVAGTGGSLKSSIAGLDQLEKADKRARGYVENGQDLLAGDVIFTEMRDILDQSAGEVSAARTLLARTHEQETTSVRREQAGLALAAMAIWLVIAATLVPTPPAQAETEDWRQKLGVRLKPPPPVEDSLNLHLAPVAPAHLAPAHLAPQSPDLLTAAVICSDLSALADIGALPGALSRACDVLGAIGVIVWVASTDGSRLSPVASHGYDPKLLARIGGVPRDANNLTSVAFRDATPRANAATEKSPASLAVPMCGPSGPVGVMSAELQPGRTADQSCIALATIFAAQLATLAMPVPASLAEAPETAEGRFGRAGGPKQAQA